MIPDTLLEIMKQDGVAAMAVTIESATQTW